MILINKNIKIKNILSYFILIVISIIWIFPFFYLIIQSFRLEPGATTNYFWPKQIGFDNYIYIFTAKSPFNFTKWYINTFIVAIITCILQTIIILMVSYAFSRIKFKLKKSNKTLSKNVVFYIIKLNIQKKRRNSMQSPI